MNTSIHTVFLLGLALVLQALSLQAGSPQTIDFPAIPDKLSTDAPFALVAAASSGLPISYALASAGGVAAVSGSALTLTGVAGAVTVKASQPGNGTYDPAAVVYRTFLVVDAAQRFVKISMAAMASHIAGILSDGMLWAWGDNSYGKVGEVNKGDALLGEGIKSSTINLTTCLASFGVIVAIIVSDWLVVYLCCLITSRGKKHRYSGMKSRLLTAAVLLLIAMPHAAAGEPEVPTQPQMQPIRMDQLGAEAQKQYAGDGISITPTKDGASLKAVMQDLEAEATREGLWLMSTSDEDAGKPNRFRIKALEIGGEGSKDAPRRLADHGTVRATQEVVAWLRPGLVEEYSVSADGVRQDFIILERPAIAGALRVALEVTGAQAQTARDGANLTVDATRRELAYNRLRVTDAKGKELTARMEVPAPNRLHITVDDSVAIYPIRIDPTFSDADWTSLNPDIQGANGTVYALTVDAGSSLYIGGDFTFIGSLAANRIAKWNGSAWSALGSGMNTTVRALAVSGGTIYAGGDFTTAGGVAASRIAKWNGSAWSAFGSGANNTVRALTVSGSDLYVAGDFTILDGTAYNRIAKWNGSAWSALVSGTNNIVRALIVSGTTLYAGGDFTSTGGVTTNRVAKWDGSVWSALGSGMNGSVNAFALQNSILFVGGSFNTAGGLDANRVARWDGTTWSALESGVSNTVHSLVYTGGSLYVGGTFTSPNRGIAKWDGASWGGIHELSGGTVYALAVFGGKVHAGGDFTYTPTGPAYRLAQWNNFPGSRWEIVGLTMNGYINSLALSGSTLYAGGTFTTAGGQEVNRVARWNGSSWSALGTGVNGTVHALVISGSEVYAGGEFSSAGGVLANRVAKWNGSSWSALSTGMNNTVYALVGSSSNLYAGGAFTNAGGFGADYIARWNGSTWSEPGGGVGYWVYALAVNGTDLYAGGDFTTAGGQQANRVALWNGSTWSALGAGVSSGSVRALVSSGGSLYVGGSFTSAGGVTVNRVAKWTTSTGGGTWQGLNGSGNYVGTDGVVNALAVSNDNVYVGGNFTSASGVNDARYVAKWSGGIWSVLGAGVNGAVHSLVISGTNLYAGGQFYTAGGKVSNYAANANIGQPRPILTLGAASSIYGTRATVHGAANPNDAATTARFEYGLTTAYGSIVNVTLSPNNGGVPQNVSANLTGLTVNMVYYYRLTATNSGGTASTTGGSFTTAYAPEIGVEQPAGTSLVDGSTSVSFGSVATVTSDTRTFTVRNTGDGNLNLGSISFSGGNSTDFSVTSPPAATVAPGASTTFTVAFAPPMLGPRATTLRIPSNDVDENPFEITLNGIGLAPEIGVEHPVGTNLADGAAAVGFGSIEIGNNATRTFTINNTGNDALTTIAVTFNGGNAGDFVVTAPSPSSLAVSGAASFTVSFAPTALGARATTMRVASNDSDENPFDIILNGTGTTPEIAVEQPVGTNLTDGISSSNFGGSLVGSSVALNFVVLNTGSGNLFGLSATVSGNNASDFSVIEQPANLLQLGQSTALTVQFTPSAIGPRTALLRIASNDLDENPFDITLNGTGTVPEIVVEYAGNGLTDGVSDVSLGSAELTSDAAYTFTIRNTGGASLTGVNFSISGGDVVDFSRLQLPSGTISPGSSTTFRVSFTPTALGTRTTTILVSSSDSDENPFGITLTGTGIPATPEIGIQQPAGTNLVDGVTTVDFGLLEPGSPSVTKPFTIQSLGYADLDDLIVTISGTNSADFELNSSGVPSTLPRVNGSAGFTVSYAPAATGPRSATLHIASNDTDENPFDIPITGYGAPQAAVSDLTVNENDGTAQVVVTLNQATSADTMIDWSTSSGSASSGSDYTHASGTLTIPAGQLSGNIPVTLINNTVPELDEYFLVSLTSAPNTIITDSSATVTVIDDDLVRLDWDDGQTDLGTSTYHSLVTAAGSYYFRIQTQPTVQGGWRTSLRVAAGEANLYLRKSDFPTTSNYDHRSNLAGSDGLVLRPEQYVENDVWYGLVEVTSAGSWSLTSGEIYVENLGPLPFTDTDSDNVYDIGEEVTGSGGSRTLPPEGVRFFRQAVPAGAPAWALWLNGGPRSVALRRGQVPHQPTVAPSYSGVYDLLQERQMLVVPPYLGSGMETYFLSVSGNPGEVVNLDSRIQVVETLTFDQAGVAVNTTPAGATGGRTSAPYRSYRVTVENNTLAWDVAVTPSSGDAQVAVGTLNSDSSGSVVSGVPNEFYNTAFSEAVGAVTDSVTLVPQTLTDGTWFITVYGAGAFTATLKQGHPEVTTIPFYSANAADVTNDLTNRAGWRYYQVRDILSQVGTLGWELQLSNQVGGSEIALRRNAVPGRWSYRWGATAQSSSTGFTEGHVDHSSTNGLLQRPGHQSDIWYVGVYSPLQALGAFTLTRREIEPPGLAFDGAAEAVSGHALDTWRYFRIDVPAAADVLGWDLRLTNITAGSPQLVVARDVLPLSNGTSGGLTSNSSWSSGQQWAASRDWTGGSAERIVVSMGRPLQPGTYYVGVLAQGSGANGYTIQSRAIGRNGSGRAIQTLPDVTFAGGSAPLTNLVSREPAYFKVSVPAGAASWQVKLTPSSGEMMLVVLKGVLPNSDAGLSGKCGIVMQRTGHEFYHLFPGIGETTIPDGDYYFAAVGETGTASAVFQSVGVMPVANLGNASTTPVSTAVSVAPGEVTMYQFAVPAGAAGLEVKLSNVTGQPGFTLLEGAAIPSPYSFYVGDSYGYEGGASWNGSGQSGSIYTRILNFPVAATTYTVAIRGAHSIAGNSTANLVFRTLPVEPLAFNGGSISVTNQEAGTWRLFQTTVPTSANLLGWDVWIKNVTGGDPELMVARDTLPQGSGSSSLPYGSTWSPGAEWPVSADWTHRSYDPPSSRSVEQQRMVASMGRPLEPGTYYVAVRLSGSSASYNLQSRGIGQPGSGMNVELAGTVAFNGGSTTVTNLAPREAAYVKVTVPAGQPSWQVKLTPSAGEMMFALARGAIPNSYAGQRGFESGSIERAGITALKQGDDLFHLFPTTGTTIPSGDYNFAIISEGTAPANGSTVGTGTSSALFQSLGPIPVTSLGTASTTPTTTAVSLVGGQVKLYQFDIEAGTPAFEIRLTNREGNPGYALIRGSSLPVPFMQSSGDVYGFEGGEWGGVMGTGIYTLPNPPAGTYTMSMRAGPDTGGYPAASANIVFKALPVSDISFDGSSTVVSDQEPTTWRYFRVTVPSGVLGWDLWLKNLSGSATLEVRRDLMPGDNFASVVSLSDSQWPSGHYLHAGLDWTGYSLQSDGSSYQDRRMVAAMGRPLEPGTYCIGVRADGASATSYTLQSRGIGEAGSGLEIEVADTVAFAGGSASAPGIPPREAAYFKVTVPPGQPSWQVRLQPTQGDMMLAGRLGGIPNNAYLPSGVGDGGGIKLKKVGEEWYHLFPTSGQSTITPGDYYFAVISEGAGPVNGQIGTGVVSGVITSLGAMPVTSLGPISTAGVTSAVSLAGGEVRHYSFDVPAGTVAFDLLLENRVGNLLYAIKQGSAILRPPKASPTDNYGFEGGVSPVAEGAGVYTLNNPTPGIYTISLRAASPLDPATGDLVIRQKVLRTLNFTESLNGNGQSHTDTRSLLDGESTLYAVDVPMVLSSNNVIGWRLDVNALLGNPTLRIFPDLNQPGTNAITVTNRSAILVPPYLTPGTRWYVEVIGGGFTEYQITSSNITRRNVAPWQMPLTFNTQFGDSADVDIGEDEWHFYAVDVPGGNLGLMRTVLEAPNGDPQLYIREDGVPTLSHQRNGSTGGTLVDRELDGGGTEYGNWVPLNGRTEKQLRSGRWYLGVKAQSSHARYRLLVSTGVVADLALVGGNLTSQVQAGGDWRYYRFTVPEDAPLSWTLSFGQQMGDVVMHLRDTVPPGHDDRSSNSQFDILNAYDDSKNQGPYSDAGYDYAGSYDFILPPLRPGHTYFAGFRAKDDSRFSITSATASESVGVLPELPFMGGSDTPSIPAGGHVTYLVRVPADAMRWKHSISRPAGVELRIENGTIPLATGTNVHYLETTPGNQLDQILGSWPWLAGHTYYLTLINTSTFSQTVPIQIGDLPGGQSFATAVAAAGLSGADATFDATPHNDGVENLLKYAFNMNLGGPDATTMSLNGTSGLPAITVHPNGINSIFRYEFLRRKNSNLIYTPQKSGELTNPASWTPLTDTPIAIPIDATWERVIYEETYDATITLKCFGRVQVTLAP
ncbi:MAG: choice-of-anchor D domain-containing protein [Verrucomicrobiaceae bacterium]|nr:choice-of-anchor D domain-containing protein [Verrucomicrobiaceae bacterium]